MTFKMEGSGEMKVTTESLTQAASDVLDAKAVDRAQDASHMIRERNLLLLSVLYYLYGEEWRESPDWNKVSLTIQNKKIPHYGDDFTPQNCERRYKSLMENGYEVGFGAIMSTLKAPKRLNEAQKRLWILASTSTDIVVTSRILDEKMRIMYKDELAKIERVGAGEYNMEPSEMELEDEILPLEGEDEFKFEAIEMEKLAADVGQCETMEKIIGMQDVLPLIRFCYEAVQYAVSKQASLTLSKKKSAESASSAKDADITDTSKGTLPVHETSQGSSNVPQTVINETSGEKEKETAQLASSTNTQTLSKLETTSSSSGQTKPESSSPVKHDSSPQKTSKPSTRGSTRDKTQIEPEPKEETTTASSEGADTPSNTSNATRNSTKETNGDGNEHSKTANKDSSDSGKSVIKTDSDNSSTKSKGADGNDIEKKNDCSAAEKPKLEMPDQGIEFELMDSAPGTIVGSTQASTIEITFEPETASKSKKPSAKKGSSSTPIGTSPASSRTSSRLASPEPENEAEKHRKSLSRQHSGSDNNSTVGLRSRRGTPTKANSVERDAVKDSPVEKNLPMQALDEIVEDAFETQTPTPDSPGAKSDLDTSENRPKQPKVYTVKPPSPLSHVDPKLFEELNDEEEDEELAAIDDSVNKSRNEKNSSAKAFSKRGRTASSENASENNDESNQNKRSTRRHGLQDDGDEGDGTGNNEDSAHKRLTRSKLTRSSLKLWDAENDEGENVTNTGSDKAVSESSFSGKEKKSRQSKTQLRARRLFDEKQRLYGDGETEETPEGKRVTRARAKTSTSTPEVRSKSSSRGESESTGDSESTTARATRSRASTAGNVPVVDATTPQTSFCDEDDKTFRKNTLSLLEKIIGHETATTMQKYFPDDPSKVIKYQADFQSIKQKLESGKIKTPSAFQKDLCLLVLNTLLAHPSSQTIKEASLNFHKWVKTCSEDAKSSRNLTTQKIDNSDVESLESHEDARSETTSKPPSNAGGRRKRKRSASETSAEEFSSENKRRVTRTSVSSYQQQAIRKPKHPISPDIVSANRVRH